MYNLLKKTIIMINSINVSEKTNEELIKDLEAKKAEAVASDDFEEAIKIRDQIKELKFKETTKESESDIAEKADQIKTNAEEHKKEMNDMKTKADEEKTSKIDDLMWQLNGNNSDLEKKEVNKESLEWKLKDYFNTLATNPEKALFLAQLLQNKNKWEEWLDTNSPDYNAGIWVFGSVIRWFNLKEENVRSLYMWIKIPINEEIYSNNELSKSAIDSFVKENLKELAKDDNLMKGIKAYISEIWSVSGMENQVKSFKDILNKSWIDLLDWSNKNIEGLGGKEASLILENSNKLEKKIVNKLFKRPEKFSKWPKEWLPIEKNIEYLMDKFDEYLKGLWLLGYPNRNLINKDKSVGNAYVIMKKWFEIDEIWVDKNILNISNFLNNYVKWAIKSLEEWEDFFLDPKQNRDNDIVSRKERFSYESTKMIAILSEFIYTLLDLEQVTEDSDVKNKIKENIRNFEYFTSEINKRVDNYSING